MVAADARATRTYIESRSFKELFYAPSVRHWVRQTDDPQFLRPLRLVAHSATSSEKRRSLSINLAARAAHKASRATDVSSYGQCKVGTLNVPSGSE